MLKITTHKLVGFIYARGDQRSAKGAIFFVGKLAVRGSENGEKVAFIWPWIFILRNKMAAISEAHARARTHIYTHIRVYFCFVDGFASHHVARHRPSSTWG